MENILKLIKTEFFWRWFLIGTALLFLLQTFIMGRWALPFVGYQVPYMNPVSVYDWLFAVLYALVFAFGLVLFVSRRKFSPATCAVGSGSGLLAMFTMLCPVCPVFFLTYFGLSASIFAFAPYFWAIRLIALALVGLAVYFLLKNFELKDLPEQNAGAIFRKVAVIMIAVLFVGNQALAIQLATKLTDHNHSGGEVKLSGVFASDVAALVTPTSLPFYGQELGLDFSSVNAINASIAKMSKMAPMQGSNPIQLTTEEMKRYVEIGTEPYVTCEFCCGVTTLVRKDGSPTCGCAHSIAMRGTAAYLLRTYPELTNAEIAYELMRQKGLYFPVQMQERMASSLAGDITQAKPDIKYLIMNLSDAELADLQSKAKSEGFQPEKAPDMVGGC